MGNPRASAPLQISWAEGIVKVRGGLLPPPGVEIWYLEAFCRSGSRCRPWGETLIGHQTRLIRSEGEQAVELETTLDDRVVVRHRIEASGSEIDFRVTLTNPSDDASEVHWAQPCVRVGRFAGAGDGVEDYIGKCFVFVDDELVRLKTKEWTEEALYTPGQVWCAPGVSDDDVNPRPLNPVTLSNGLIGCFSEDESVIVATAWEPYQELFQGVIQCIHSDFRIGGLAPGEEKTARGKLYCLDANVEKLLERYKADFPEHQA